MISKIIHYCWFGGKPLDDKAHACIESWRRFFPDYRIIQWNEENYDYQKSDFARKAYENQKWAFVSDVARLEVIYQYGGIYFDTDVEVIKSYDDILEESPVGFMGMDYQQYVNTGLGFGAEKDNPLLKTLLELYEGIDYNEYQEHLSEIACPILMNKYLHEKGIEIADGIQTIFGFTIYPHDYFNPLDYLSGRIVKTQNTHSIHWYNDSWNTEDSKKVKKSLQKYRRIFGTKYGEMLFGVSSSIKEEGLFSFVKRHLRRKN